MDGKHTKGPWIVNPEGDFIRDASGNAVACVYGEDGGVEHDECMRANAALIASAPALLSQRDALREVLGNLSVSLRAIGQHWLADIADKALSKDAT
jgi:hypothetical protein